MVQLVVADVVLQGARARVWMGKDWRLRERTHGESGRVCLSTWSAFSVIPTCQSLLSLVCAAVDEGGGARVHYTTCTCDVRNGVRFLLDNRVCRVSLVVRARLPPDGKYKAVKDGRKVLRDVLTQWRRNGLRCCKVVQVRKGGATSGSSKLSRGIEEHQAHSGGEPQP